MNFFRKNTKLSEHQDLHKCNKDEVCTLCSQSILFSSSVEKVKSFFKKLSFVTNGARQQFLGIFCCCCCFQYFTFYSSEDNHLISLNHFWGFFAVSKHQPRRNLLCIIIFVLLSQIKLFIVSELFEYKDIGGQ